MAKSRRSKELTTQERINVILKNIAETEIEISDAELHLSNLNIKKKDLEDQLRQEKITLLLETMEAKDISLDRAKEIIDSIV